MPMSRTPRDMGHPLYLSPLHPGTRQSLAGRAQGEVECSMLVLVSAPLHRIRVLRGILCTLGDKKTNASTE